MKSRKARNRARRQKANGTDVPRRDIHAQNAACLNRTGGAGRHEDRKKRASRRACRGPVSW